MLNNQSLTCGRRHSSLGLLCLALISAAALIAASAAGADHGRRVTSQVSVVTSGDFSERVDHLPIDRGRPGDGEVVMSLAPSKLPSIEAGDRLVASTEVQLTVDCHKPGPRCIGNPYEFNPDLEFQIVLGSSPTQTEADGALALGAPRREVCRQKPPNREHHCVVVFDRTLQEVPATAPCLQSRCYVNLVGAADDPQARHNQVLAVGGLRPNGSVPQDRGRLNVVRFHPAGTAPSTTTTTTDPFTSRLTLDQHRAAVFSQPIYDLRRREQLVVDVRARVDISRLPYNVVLASQLILSDEPGGTERGVASSLAGSRGEFDEGNAFNCTKNLGVCTIHKLGVIQMKDDAVKSGEPLTLYVNLVTNAGPKHLEAKPGDRVQVLDGGSLEVTRYAAYLNG